MGQGIRIHWPMQGTEVQSLVWADSMCCRVTKPVHHNYWPCTLEPTGHNYWSLSTWGPSSCKYWACVPQLLKPTGLEPVLRNTRSHHKEKPMHRNSRVAPARPKERKAHAASKTQHSHKLIKKLHGAGVLIIHILWKRNENLSPKNLPCMRKYIKVKQT